MDARTFNMSDVKELVGRLADIAANSADADVQCAASEAASALSRLQSQLSEAEKSRDEWCEQAQRDSALAVCNETLKRERGGLEQDLHAARERIAELEKSSRPA